MVSVASGPLRPRWVGPRERASKHSKGLRCWAEEAEREMEEGVTMRNLLVVVEEEVLLLEEEEVGEGCGGVMPVVGLRCFFSMRAEVVSLLRAGMALGAVVEAREARRDLLASGRFGSRLMMRVVGERGLAVARGLTEAEWREGECELE